MMKKVILNSVIGLLLTMTLLAQSSTGVHKISPTSKIVWEGGDGAAGFEVKLSNGVDNYVVKVSKKEVLLSEFSPTLKAGTYTITVVSYDIFNNISEPASITEKLSPPVNKVFNIRLEGTIIITEQ